MEIVRTSTCRVLAPFNETFGVILDALTKTGAAITDSTNPIQAATKRSLRANRWAAATTAGVRQESATTTLVDWTVDKAGDKHHDVIRDVFGAMAYPVDDLGVADALRRLGKAGRFFGASEAGALSQYVHVDERVVELAQGVYNHQGMLVLTTQRLFFFDKAMLGAQVEEFSLPAIQSLGFAKKMGGEVIDIAISGRAARISQIVRGRAETFIQAYRQVRADVDRPIPAPAAQQTPAPDLAGQIKQLADLRDAGILTEEEFIAKKADLLARM